MAVTEPASAIVIRVSVPSGLERLRRRWDTNAGLGIPAHVTILFPFVPASELDDDHRASLAEIARRHQPFDIAFRRVGRFPAVVYLAPEPSAPITALIEAIATAHADYPPYGGMFDEVVPHLTVAEADTAPLDGIAADAGRWLPFSHRAAALEVLVESPAGRWRRRWRLPLGVRP